MTATSEKQKLNGQPAVVPPRPAAAIAPRGRRRPALVVAGVAMAALGALAVMWLVASSSQRTDVVVMARDVAYGATISAADLSTTAVSVDPDVKLLAASEESSLVGKVATTNLSRGTLVTGDVASDGGVVATDEALVPLPLTAERVPAGGLAAGDRLVIVDAPPLGADPLPGTPATLDARVVRVGPPDVNGMVVVDVVSASKDAPALATRAATGRFAIVVEPAAVQP